MHSIMLFNTVFCLYFAYYLCNDQSVDAFESFIGNESDMHEHDSFEQPKIWSSLLEELTIK